ncbi:MAG: aldolase/citrate lyase family protein [Chloroflexota bacterium]|nr:aldolase/citrate lyase family protein [Chloroflexota bacterium]
MSLGTMVFEFNTTGIARIAALAGAEFAIFDQEHTGWSVETIRMLVATSGAASLVPMVRVPAAQYHLIARTLDVGVQGVMVPLVESVEQARMIVRSAKYPPVGRRGAAFGVAHDDYDNSDFLATITRSNEELLVIAQIETTAGVENVEAIAQVEGIDCLWVGHFDLTNSMGIPGQFDHPRYMDAIKRVVDACNRSGIAAGFMPTTPDMAVDYIERGFRAIAYSGDLWLYQTALRTGLKEIRERVTLRT